MTCARRRGLVQLILLKGEGEGESERARERAVAWARRVMLYGHASCNNVDFSKPLSYNNETLSRSPPPTETIRSRPCELLRDTQGVSQTNLRKKLITHRVFLKGKTFPHFLDKKTNVYISRIKT